MPRLCSQKKPKFPRVSEKQHLQIYKIDARIQRFFFSLLLLLFFHYQGKTPYKIDRSVENWQKAIITKHGNNKRFYVSTFPLANNGNRRVGPKG